MKELKELWHGYRDNFLDQAGDIVRFIKSPFRNVNWYAWGEVLAAMTIALLLISLVIGAIILFVFCFHWLLGYTLIGG